MVLSQGKNQYSLGLFLEMLRDKEKQWDIDEITSGSTDFTFSPVTAPTPNFGFTEEAYWFRVRLNNQRVDQEDWILDIAYPLLDRVELFHLGLDGHWIGRKTGDLLPFNQREVSYRGFAFHISLPPGREQTLYLRIETESSMQVPCTLWTPDSFSEKLNRENYILGIYYGIMLSLMIYNFFLMLRIKERCYGFYVLYIFFYIFTQLSLNGISFHFLWPQSPMWANKSVPFFISLSIFWILLFTLDFLKTKTFLPRAYPVILYGISSASLVLMFLSLLAPYRVSILFAAGLMLVGCPTSIFVSIATIRRGFRPGYYFFLAWSLFLVGIILSSIKNLGFLPFHFITEYGVQVGSAMEVILLSFGLADRIHRLRLEKEKTSRTLAKRNADLKREILEKHEMEQALRTAKEKLETMVDLRTRDLAEINRSLRLEIQEHQQTEKKLKIAKSAAESSSSAKSQFLANMSHEIRTPLAAVVGFSQLLLTQRENTLFEDESQKFLKNIKLSGEHLMEIINQILDFSKIEAGKMTLSNEPVNLKQMLGNFCQTQRVLANQSGVEFTSNLSSSLPEFIETDQTKLRQILMNLANNAMKFTPNGKSAQLHAAFEKNRLILKMIDQGIGIPEKQLERIFYAFEQAEETTTKRFGGTGLGLAISQKLVTLLGGELRVQSTLGIGSTFELILPVKVIHKPREIVSEKQRKSLPTKFDSTSKILVAEDNLMNFLMLKTMLKRMGLDIHHAENGERAVENAIRLKPDLIFMDMHMPVMDGLAATRIIRSRTNNSRLPIVALTADAFDDQRKKASELGIVDYITKPIRPEELIAVLNRYLGSSAIET